MREQIPTNNLVLRGRRRAWIPGRVACWLFLLGFWRIWPINHLIWEIRG